MSSIFDDDSKPLPKPKKSVAAAAAAAVAATPSKKAPAKRAPAKMLDFDAVSSESSESEDNATTKNNNTTNGHAADTSPSTPAPAAPVAPRAPSPVISEAKAPIAVSAVSVSAPKQSPAPVARPNDDDPLSMLLAADDESRTSELHGQRNFSFVPKGAVPDVVVRDAVKPAVVAPAPIKSSSSSSSSSTTTSVQVPVVKSTSSNSATIVPAATAAPSAATHVGGEVVKVKKEKKKSSKSSKTAATAASASTSTSTATPDSPQPSKPTKSADTAPAKAKRVVAADPLDAEPSTAHEQKSSPRESSAAAAALEQARQQFALEQQRFREEQAAAELARNREALQREQEALEKQRALDEERERLAAEKRAHEEQRLAEEKERIERERQQLAAERRIAEEKQRLDRERLALQNEKQRAATEKAMRAELAAERERLQKIFTEKLKGERERAKQDEAKREKEREQRERERERERESERDKKPVTPQIAISLTQERLKEQHDSMGDDPLSMARSPTMSEISFHSHSSVAATVGESDVHSDAGDESVVAPGALASSVAPIAAVNAAGDEVTAPAATTVESAAESTTAAAEPAVATEPTTASEPVVDAESSGVDAKEQPTEKSDVTPLDGDAAPPADAVPPPGDAVPSVDAAPVEAVKTPARPAVDPRKDPLSDLMGGSGGNGGGGDDDDFFQFEAKTPKKVPTVAVPEEAASSTTNDNDEPSADVAAAAAEASTTATDKSTENPLFGDDNGSDLFKVDEPTAAAVGESSSSAAAAAPADSSSPLEDNLFADHDDSDLFKNVKVDDLLDGEPPKQSSGEPLFGDAPESDLFGDKDDNAADPLGDGDDDGAKKKARKSKKSAAAAAYAAMAAEPAKAAAASSPASPAPAAVAIEPVTSGNMKISRSAVVPSGQHLAAVATAFDEDGMPSYVFVGRADLSSSRCNLAVLERGRKGAYQEAGHLARALNDTLAVDALAWHAARDTLYALCYTDDDRSRTGGLQLFAFPHASKRDAPPRQHVASFSGRYHHSLLFEADARRDALVGVVVDESGARAALFAFDCATGAVRRQVVRDVPSDSAALGAVYDAQYSRYVVGISGVMASSLDIYTHEGRVARLPTPKNALKPAAFANGVQRVACMEWIRKSRSFGDTVHVYALERPGAESATTVLCRLRLERSHIRDLVFTPTAEYILALYGEPPVDAVVPLTRAELDQMRGALPASKQSSSSSLLSPPAASASPSKKSASPFKRAVRSVSSSVKKLQRIVTPIPNAALEGTATKGTDALTLELGVHCLIGARNGGAVFAIMERGDVCECRLPQSEGGAPRQLQQDAGEDSIERIDIEALLRRDVAAWLARADSQALLQLVQEQPDAFKRLAKCEQHGGDDDNEQHLCCRLTSLIGSQQ